jgi:carboxylesterase
MFDEAFRSPEHAPYYWPAGPTAALLVHGFPGTPAETRALGTILHEHGWTTQGLLLPGFGREISTLGKRRMEEWVDAIVEALRALSESHESVMLIGHSAGAALSVQAAARIQPAGLILMAPFWRLGHPWLTPIWSILRRLLREIRPFRLFKPDFDDAAFRKGVEAFMPGLDLDDPVVQEQILSFAMPTSVLEQLRRAGREGYRRMPALDGVPTLVLQGNDDELVPPARTRRLLRQIGGLVEYQELPANHELLDPKGPSWPALSQAVLGFGARVRARNDNYQTSQRS